MEVWGGIECSINRVGKAYFDQLAYDNHYEKPALLQHIVELGVKSLRFPILWEKNQQAEHIAPKWVVGEHLELLRQNGVNVIAGLVHHGSGPRYAEIHQVDFPEKLAKYAKLVALAFPWITDFTPINEPLTTARFCGLYGLWYPHGQDSKTFLQILINECKATVLAMQAIREVNPKARLVFTDDLTKIHGTAEVADQVNFENNRRWLSIDLLCGMVKPGHPLWSYLLRDVSEASLQFFIENAMPPDILGFNYYVTSERYLDHRLENHDVTTHGGNGKIAYADIEAVRHGEAKVAGVANLMREAWERYKLPMAITEAHLCCGREDQLRWLQSIWDACSMLNQEGIKILAVTFWSLFGAYGWDNLLRAQKGNYEPGAFDFSSGELRPTAVAQLIRSTAKGLTYKNPVVQGRGWWQQKERPGKKQRPILIIGGSGTLGLAFTKICMERNLHFIAPKRKKLDLGNPVQLEKTIQRHRPWAIINAAGYVKVDEAEIAVEDCLMANAIHPISLAQHCAEHQIQLLTFSSDLVFDGTKASAYIEADRVKPLNIYGHSKAEAEKHVSSIYPSALLIRTSAFFGPWDKYNFVTNVLENLKKGNRFIATGDLVITATYVPHLVHAALDLLIDQEMGIWHLSNVGEITWYELAVAVAQKAGYSSNLIDSVPQQEAMQPAARPKNSALNSAKGKRMPSLEEGLNAYFQSLI